MICFHRVEVTDCDKCESKCRERGCRCGTIGNSGGNSGVRCPFHFVDTTMTLLFDLEEKTIDDKKWRVVTYRVPVLIAPDGRMAQSYVYFCEECGFIATFARKKI